jgi:tRNA(adenine34) deaminase
MPKRSLAQIASSGILETMRHEEGMRQAIEQARLGLVRDEVPIGAILVAGDRVLGADFNRPIGSCDPTAHAEILVLRQAAAALSNYRLVGTTLYVTVEPCLMCVGALVNARVGTLVYGAAEPKFGAITSLVDLSTVRVNHRLEIVPGILEEECRALLVDFFKSRRDRG